MPKSYRIKKIPQGTWVAESPTDVITFPDFYNPLDYGPPPDGIASNSAAINLAFVDAVSNGGGTILLSEGVWRAKNLPLYPTVSYVGSGIGATIIKLEDNANCDLFSAYTSSINLSGVVGTGSAIGANAWRISNMTLDGNKANQSGGTSYPIRAYGYGYMLEHVEVVNGYSGNILVDWNGSANPAPPANSIIPRWHDVSVHDCNEIGIQVGGPTDMQWDNVNVFNTGSHPVHIAPNAVVLRMVNCHFWGTPVGVGAVTFLGEAAGLIFTSCQIEGSDTCALVLLGNDNQSTSLEVGTEGDVLRAGRGIQLGQQAGQTPYAGQIYQSGGHTSAAASNVNQLSAKILGCNAGALDEQNTRGNTYDLNIYQAGGTGIVGGYPNQFSSGKIAVSGLTQDGSPGKGGIWQLANGSFNGFRIFDKNGNILFNVDTYDSVFAVDNGHSFSGYVDAGVTEVYRLNAGDGSVSPGTASGLGGALRSGSGAPSSGLGSNGDYYFRTDTPGTANQRIYVKSAGAWVGIV